MDGADSYPSLEHHPSRKAAAGMMSETQPENSGHPVGRQPADPPFAVTDPLTGELVRAYPTDTDDVLSLRVTAAHSAFRPWSVRHVESRATLMRRVADLHHERRAELAAIIAGRWASPTRRPSARSTSAQRSTATTPTMQPSSWQTRRSRCSTDQGRPSSVGNPLACSSGSCLGTTPTTRSRGSPAPT